MYLIKNATIINAASTYHQRQVDILINAEGYIQAIEKSIQAPKDAKIVSIDNLYVSSGWIDVGVHSGEPGHEEREDLNHLTAAAAAGGYTEIAIYPNTSPTIQDKSGVQYFMHNTQHTAINCYPIGAITKSTKGKEITEMIDMYHAGAIAFSDGNQAIQHSGVMMRALQYVKHFNGLIINAPSDESIAGKGMVHEGKISTSIGTKGLPKIAEVLMVERDLKLLDYTSSKLHIANISCKESVDLIRMAKARGLNVSCSVPVLNLAYTDDVMLSFDTNFKVFPPLRGHEDVEALKEGLKDGTIDWVTSNHTPWHEEAKKLEFLYAEFGAIGLETTFALLHQTLAKVLSLEAIIDKLTIIPRKVLNLPQATIEPDITANLTLFTLNEPWTYDKSFIRSKAQNSPLLGQSFKAQVKGIFNKGQLVLN